MDLNQRIYFQSKGITVTDLQLTIVKSSYPLSSIAGTRLESLSPRHWFEWTRLTFLLVIGVFTVGPFFGLWAMMGMATPYMQLLESLTRLTIWLLLAIMAIQAIADVRAKVVRVALVSGQDERVRVSNRDIGERLISSINAALTDRERVYVSPAAVGVADELSRLAQLRDTGVLSFSDWEQAKAMFFGKPPSDRDEAISHLQRLHDLHRAGVLSESEFNTKKWEVLSTT